MSEYMSKYSSRWGSHEIKKIEVMIGSKITDWPFPPQKNDRVKTKNISGSRSHILG
jgi:hypothetical protein